MNAQRLIGIVLAALGIVLLIILALVKVDVDRQGAFLCEEVSATGGDMASCPAHHSDSSWLIMVGFGLAVLVAGAGVFLLVAGRLSASATKASPTDLSKLNEEEKSLVKIVQAAGGSAYQGDLVKESGFSKVKTTRVLDRLEQKGVVERKRRGMTNIVVLK